MNVATAPAVPTSRWRLMFDNNVWRYLIDHQDIEPLRKAARAARCQIVIAPAVVYEMLATPDQELMRRLLAQVTRACWYRPMTEVYEESVELRHEIARLRPQWLVPHPDLRAWHARRSDWSGGGFWKRARAHPETEAAILVELDQGLASAALDQQLKARQLFREQSVAFETLSPEAQFGFDQELEGWDGTAFEMWRSEGEAIWWTGLFGPLDPSPWVEWLGPFLDIAALRRNRASWRHMWLHEVDKAALSRVWVRAAVGMLQATRKTGAGSPVDNQISGYLPDCDVFATADKTFAAILTRVYKFSPATIGKPVLIPPGSAALGALVTLLQEETRQRAAPEECLRELA